MIIRKADRDTEAGVMPGPDLLEAMGGYNQRLADAGALKGGEGLKPSSEGFQVSFVDGKPTVTEGPFSDAGDLVAGYSIIDVNSREEALEWARQWPTLDAGGSARLEVRRLFEIEDFAPGEALTGIEKTFARIESQPSGINIYLNFAGQCREAFEFYADVLGGHVAMMTTHGESPMADEVPADFHNAVMYSVLQVGRLQVMGSDAPPEWYQPPQGMFVQMEMPADKAKIAFERLAEGGQIQMPLAPTFWAEQFGMLVDRFGIPWMINSSLKDCLAEQ
ncbi:YciI family protein [Marinobacter sp. 1Y8]